MYQSSNQEYNYNIKEFDSQFAGKYISFKPCDDNDINNKKDILSKMITTSYYIREYLKSDRKIMDASIMNNDNIANIDKNDNICTYFECDKSKIDRITSLIEEYKKTDTTKFDYAEITITNDNDIWKLNDNKKSNKYYDEKMVNINYCKNKQFYEWTKLRKDLCLIFKCKSLINDIKHLNFDINDDYDDEDIKKSLVIDLNDIECHSKLWIIQYLPYFNCLSDSKGKNNKIYQNTKDFIIQDIDYYLNKKVENKKIIYVIKNNDKNNDKIYGDIKSYYDKKGVELKDINNDENGEILNIINIASKGQCFIGNFFNDLSNGIMLKRTWNNQCNVWYKTHGTMANIKFYVLTLFIMVFCYYSFHAMVYALFFKIRMEMKQYLIIFAIILFLFIAFLIVFNIFEMTVNVLMEIKFM